MKNIITILGAVLMIACCGGDPSSCKTTSDCKDPKVCVDYRCTPPVVVVPQASAASSASEVVKNDAEVVVTGLGGAGGEAGSGGKSGDGGKAGKSGAAGSSVLPLKKLTRCNARYIPRECSGGGIRQTLRPQKATP